MGIRMCRSSVRCQFSRQVCDRDQSVLANDEGTLDGVFQFADVSRPIMGHENRQRFRGDPLDGSLLQTIEARDELIHQEGQVLFASAQWGKFDAKNVHAIIEIFPEDSASDLFGQVFVGGDNHPSVGRFGTCSPQRFICALLQHAQQSYLKGGTDLADLIEKDGSPPGQREPAGFVFVRTGEGPRFVTEQFRLEERIRESAAIDGDERSLRAGAERVDRSRDEFLAGSRVSEDQHRAGTGRDRWEDFEHPLHEGTSAGQIADLESPLKFLPQRLDLREVAKGLCAADHAAVTVTENRRGNADGNATPLRRDDVSRLADDRFPRLQCLLKGARRLAHIGSKYFGAASSDRFLPGDACDLLGGPVEGSHAPSEIDRKDAIGDALENGFRRRDGKWSFHDSALCHRAEHRGRRGGILKDTPSLGWILLLACSGNERSRSRPFVDNEEILAYLDACPIRR